MQSFQTLANVFLSYSWNEGVSGLLSLCIYIYLLLARFKLHMI